jgi:hypothetical protein
MGNPRLHGSQNANTNFEWQRLRHVRRPPSPADRLKRQTDDWGILFDSFSSETDLVAIYTPFIRSLDIRPITTGIAEIQNAGGWNAAED